MVGDDRDSGGGSTAPDDVDGWPWNREVKLVFQTSPSREPAGLGEWRRLGLERPTLALLREVSVRTSVSVSSDQAKVWRDATGFERAHASLILGKVQSEFRSRSLQVVEHSEALYSGALSLRAEIRTEHFGEKSFLGEKAAILGLDWELRQRIGAVGGDSQIVATTLPVFHGNSLDFCEPLAITEVVHRRVEQMLKFFDAAVASARTLFPES